MARSCKFVLNSGNPYIDGLLQYNSAQYWDNTSSNVITFSFPSAASNYGSYPGEEVGFIACTTTEKNAIRAALVILTEYCNLVFTEITESDATHACIRYGRTTTGPGYAWAYYPDSVGEIAGDVWFGPQCDSVMAVGTKSWETIIHETGHALGLKHGHEVDGNAALPSDKDGHEYSVMTYRSWVGNPSASPSTNDNDSWPQTPMVLDILALQYIYGPKASVRTSNTVWSINPSTGEISINGTPWLTPAANRVFATLPWDSGGINTLDLSSYTSDLTLDLNEQQGSVLSTTQMPSLGSGHFPRGSIFVADGSGTEHLPDRVIIGGGNDVIVGNDIDNTVVFSGARSNYAAVQNVDQSYTLTDQRSGSPDGINTVSNVEFLEFSNVTIGTSASIKKLRVSWT